ncbi:DoxX family protein [Occultella kanbiaonis]|uniref:DoxX family protein n=1 Tax=Occultella kanbiaonis TaxID=2675754 RepID=UPI0013D5E38C|nr:DoxX family protein [Occultella kanbiaonis]
MDFVTTADSAIVAALPDPFWPVVLLALIQVVDGVLCIRPVTFIAECFDAVNFPRGYWWVTPPIKFAAAAGLIAGIWIPFLGALTSGALILYFVLAISAHIRARDFGRNLFVNATGMFVICVATGLFSFVI